MSATQGVRAPAKAPRVRPKAESPALRGEYAHPAFWIVAALLLIMPLIANGFFLIEIFATTSSATGWAKRLGSTNHLR